MSKEFIIPTATLEQGNYLLVEDAIGFATENGQYLYNPPGGTFTDPLGSLLPEVTAEVLVLIALHLPYNKEEVEIPESLEVIRNTPAVRESTAEYVPSQWKVALSKDGWTRLHLFRVPVTKNAGAWYDTATGKLYKDVTEIAPADLLKETEIRQYSRDRFYPVNAQRAHSRAVAAKTLQAIETLNYPPKMAKLKQQEDMLDTLIAGAGEQFEEGNKYNAQRIIELANKYVRDERI